MRYQDAVALRRALADRVRSAAGDDQHRTAHLRKRVAIHRLLARLFEQGGDRWVVKGGIALAYRLGVVSRPTQDLDLACHADPSQARADLLAVQQQELADFFQVIVTESERPLNLQGRAMVHRYTIQTTLAGTIFDTFKLDVAFESARDVAEMIVVQDTVLDGIGLPPLTVPVIPLSHHIADKVHAYVRLHGPTQQRSSRPKDLIDLCLIQQRCRVQYADLVAALQVTLAREGMPMALPAPPSSWAIPYRRLALSVGIDPDVQLGYLAVGRFLDPLFAEAVATDVVWEPAIQAWQR